MLQAAAEREPARGHIQQPQAHQGPGKAPRQQQGSGRGGNSYGPGQVRRRGGGRGGGRGRGSYMAVMDSTATQSLPLLGAIATPVPASNQRAIDLAARICQDFPTTYKESQTKPMSARTICLMRVEYRCPRCHGFEHVDVNKDGAALCQLPVASDWSMGPYSGRRNSTTECCPLRELSRWLTCLGFRNLPISQTS